MDLAERLTRAQCLSRSGAPPSKARAPSNTLEPSQKAWVRAPTIGWLPSSHSPSRKVKVCDQADIGFLIHRVGPEERKCSGGATLNGFGRPEPARIEPMPVNRAARPPRPHPRAAPPLR